MRQKFKPDTMYRKYEKMIKERAWFWAMNTGYDFSELLSEGEFLFMKALLSWDCKRASFSTHLYIVLNTKLPRFTNKFDTPKTDPTSLPLNSKVTYKTPLTSLMWKESIEGLSKEGREVVRIVLEGPLNVLEEVDKVSKTLVKRRLKYRLREMGWTWQMIWDTFKEIKLVLAEV